MKCVNELNCKKMRQMLFEISEENCHILFSNPSTLYIIGIGDTDYTIHRDAREILNWYQSNKPQYWYNIIEGNFHITHYFARNLQKILYEGVKREFIKIGGNVYKILDVKIEIPNKVETCIEFYGRRNHMPELKYKILTDKLNENDKFWFNVSLEQILNKI